MRQKGANPRSDSSPAVLKVKLIPRSSRNLIAGKEGDTYRIRVTAPPVDGKANHALIDFLAEELGMPKSRLQIVSGKSSRLKTLLISGLSPKEIHQRLESKLQVGG